MKTVRFDEKKNRLLKEKRGVGLDQVAEAVNNNQIVAVLDHPNKEKFPNQKIFILKLNDYIYAVPFVQTKNEIFLKTLYASRKYKKRYDK